MHGLMKKMMNLCILLLGLLCHCSATSLLTNEFDITWGGDKAMMDSSSQTLTLSLDKGSGSGFQSKNVYLYGKIDMQIKMVKGNSAGTVTSYYLKSEGSSMWDEIDFEFLGNLSGEPYTVHTNVYTQGKGDKEQQFHLWFDPTKDFHTYSILWNPLNIIFYVDHTPIREFKNFASLGVSFPTSQPMRLHSTLWNADDWATRGGLIKTDWTQAPFLAYYRNFNAQACSDNSNHAPHTCPSTSPWMTSSVSPQERQKMEQLQTNFRIYHYCNDAKRFPNGFPVECGLR